MKTKIDKQVLIKIAGVSAAISLELGIINIVITFLTASNSDILSAMSVIVSCVTGILGCFAWLGTPIIAAFYAVKQHKIHKELITDGLLMGGLAGLVAGIVYAIIGSINCIISALISAGQTAALYKHYADLYGSELAVTAGAFGIGAILGVIMGTCVYVVVYTVVGGITGLIVAALTETKGGAEKK